MVRVVVSLLFLTLFGLAWSSPASADASGAINVRLFIDRDSDSQFSAADVPVGNQELRAWGSTPVPEDYTDANGMVAFIGLPAGEYDVGSTQGTFCADYLSNNWLGTYVLGFCTSNYIPSVIVTVEDGESASVDLALQGVEAHIGGRLWLDGQAAPAGTVVTARIDGVICTADIVSSFDSYIGITVSNFSLDFPNTPIDPACDGEVIGLFAGERQFAEWTRTELWAAALTDWRFGTTFYSTSDYATPGLFYAYFGWQNLGRASIRAFVGDTVCGNRVSIESRVYGLFVLPDDIKPGCGKPGDLVSFCVGDKLATGMLTWEENLPWFLPTGGGVSDAPCPLPGLVGDTDCDGEVAIRDASLTLEHVAGLTGPGEATCLADTDSDCDRFARIPDVLAIIRYLAGLVTPGVGGCPPVGHANY